MTNRQERYASYLELRKDSKLESLLIQTTNQVSKEVFIGLKNYAIDEETQFLHERILDLEARLPYWTLSFLSHGDLFLELVSYKNYGILQVVTLPQELTWKIQTIKGKLLEYQMGKDGPDYASLSHPPRKDDPIVRFKSQEIVHIKVDHQKTYPYGIGLLDSYFDFKDNVSPFVHAMVQGISEINLRNHK